MSLFYQHNIDDRTSLGIWKIEEPESFYLEKVPLKKDVAHPYKRLQHLAGRYLLPALFTDFPLASIEIADTRKPFLPDEKYHFSISHSANYAAAIVSATHRVGVDIDLVTPTILTIAPKFLNETEQDFITDWEYLTHMYLQLTTTLWCAKEAIYKWHGLGQVNFKNHMKLNGPVVFHSNEFMELPFLFAKGGETPLTVIARIFDPLVLAWVKT